jgi:hypothetical protein
MQYPEGDEELDEVFETEAKAEEFGGVQVDNYHAGAEVLHLSNPGDYPSDGADDDVAFKVREVDD